MSFLVIFGVRRLERDRSSHLEGTFLIDFPVNRPSGFILRKKNSTTSEMIVKPLSNADCALIQRICSDQWSIQKCHNRLRALEVISHPPDEAVFRRFTLEMVCSNAYSFSSYRQFDDTSFLEASFAVIQMCQIVRGNINPRESRT